MHSRQVGASILGKPVLRTWRGAVPEQTVRPAPWLASRPTRRPTCGRACALCGLCCMPPPQPSPARGGGGCPLRRWWHAGTAILHGRGAAPPPGCGGRPGGGAPDRAAVGHAPPQPSPASGGGGCPLRWWHAGTAILRGRGTAPPPACGGRPGGGRSRSGRGQGCPHPNAPPQAGEGVGVAMRATAWGGRRSCRAKRDRRPGSGRGSDTGTAGDGLPAMPLRPGCGRARGPAPPSPPGP